MHFLVAIYISLIPSEFGFCSFRSALLEYLSGDPDGISTMQRRGFVHSFIRHMNLHLVCARQFQQEIGQTQPLLQSPQTAVCVSGGGGVWLVGEDWILALETSGA